MARHKRTHTGEKSYVCDWDRCTVAFGYSSGLSKHKKRHAKKRLMEEIGPVIPLIPMALEGSLEPDAKRRQFEEIGE